MKKRIIYLILFIFRLAPAGDRLDLPPDHVPCTCTITHTPDKLSLDNMPITYRYIILSAGEFASRDVTLAYVT